MLSIGLGHNAWFGRGLVLGWRILAAEQKETYRISPTDKREPCDGLED
jgi:hypothetical protein